jgi:hypothetical protein
VPSAPSLGIVRTIVAIWPSRDRTIEMILPPPNTSMVPSSIPALPLVTPGYIGSLDCAPCA